MTRQEGGAKILEVLKVILLPLAIAVVGGAFSWFQQRAAIEKQYLDRVALLLEDLASEDSARKALAIAYMDSLAREGKITQEFADALARIALEQALGRAEESEVESPAVARAVETSFENVRRQVVDALPTRVFLHIAEESMRGASGQLRGRLEEKGYLVPGIERVDGVPERSQLRFLNESDGPQARDIQRVLEELGYSVEVKDLSSRYEGTVKPKTFEVWLAAP